MPTLDVDLPRRHGPRVPEQTVLIRAEQVRAQYRNMPGTFVGSALVASFVAAMLSDSVPGNVLLPWLAGIYLVSGTRYWLWRRFSAAETDLAQITRWGRLAIIAAGASGVLWGVGGLVLHVSGNLPYQVFVLFAITGLAFTSTYLTASLMPAFLAYAYPSLVLSAIPFLLAGDLLHAGIGIATLLYLPWVTHYAAHVSGSFLDSVSVRLQNAQLVRELREQKEAAEEANVAKSRFLAVASHDLRQPLHALGLFVQALQESPIATQERQIVNHIRRAVDAMEELFDALLDISRLDAGAVRPQIETFPLASVFDRLRLEFGPIAHQKRLSLKVMKTCAYIRSDPSLLARIVGNLLSNAVRYTDRGGLVLGCRRQGEELRIEVWDTGRGIPVEKHREIFREFSQLERTEAERRTGLGLGLAIVERLARLLDHAVQVRSRPGKGSVFAISVPRGRREDSIVEAAAELTTAFDLTGVLILVIDSDPAVRQAMDTLLRKWNCDVVIASSGAEMKDKVALVRRVPDLIISDYRARGAGNAVGVVELLRNEFNSEIPALFLTGDTGLDRARDQEVGGMPILHKPLNPARLRTLIANLLRMDETRARRAG